ncbi:MAG: ribonuclease R, partial [Peptostreptococcaceae bacterium]
MLPGLKERVIGLINEPAYNPLKKEELAIIFAIHPTEMPMFYNFLDELEEDGYISRTKKGKIISPNQMGYFVGKFVSHRKGFGFVESDEEYTQDLFIPACDINGAMHNDRVMAEVVTPATDDKRAEGRILKVIKREITKVVGTFQSNKNF